jgi:hypothetical protein
MGPFKKIPDIVSSLSNYENDYKGISNFIILFKFLNM